MKRKNRLWFFLLSLGLVACGTKKEFLPYPPDVPPPHFDKPVKEVVDGNTFTLKAEDLKLTHVTQAWKYNRISQTTELENYLKLQKRFAFPIQFNGWVSLDRVENLSVSCAGSSPPEVYFILEDDHGGALPITHEEKIPVTLEKLYVVRAEVRYTPPCQAVEIHFGVLYGTDD